MEALLLEDYKYGEPPQSVANLLQYFNEHKISPDKNDILAGFVYILMLECGFVAKDYDGAVTDCDFNCKRILELSKNLPEGWKRHRNYHFEFILKSAPHCVCNLSCITACEDFIINCVIKDLKLECFSLILDPLTYFTSSNIRLDSFNYMFQNLKQLSMLFKNEIAFPAKSTIVYNNGGICACLLDLPRELLLKVLNYLTLNDLLNLAKCNRYLCGSVQDINLWVKLLDLDFKKRNIVKTVDELKFLYDIKYGRELAKIMHKGP